MDKLLKETKEHYYNNYFEEHIPQRIKYKVLNEIKHNQKTAKKGNKLFYFSSTIVLIIALLIGSASYFPSVSAVLAKIPVLNVLFENNSSLLEIIYDDLTELDYQVGGLHLNASKKTISIEILGDEEYVNEVKADVKQAVEQKLHSIGINAYTIEVSRSILTYPLADMPEADKDKIDEYIQLSKELESEIMKKLIDGGYHVYSAHVRVNDLEKFIPLELPITETRDSEIKHLINDLLDEKSLDNFSIKIYKTDPVKDDAEKRWAPIISTIADGLIGNSQLKVDGVAYSFYPSPLTLTITTSVKSTYSHAEELINNIETEINEFIHSEEVDDFIKNYPYTIEIYSKDNKLLN